MTREASKAMWRRSKKMSLYGEVFVGEGVDIGAGNDCIELHKDKFPKMGNVRNWDMPDGDAQLMASVADETFDFVHSSHCLEHMRDPYVAVENWLRILKPGGHLVVTIPDWEMYEKKMWPSRFNSDHKTSWTMSEERCADGNHIFHLPTFLKDICARHGATLLHTEKLTLGWDPFNPRDQTIPPSGPECALEFVVKKNG